jgi:hypothetical protein
MVAALAGQSGKAGLDPEVGRIVLTGADAWYETGLRMRVVIHFAQSPCTATGRCVVVRIRAAAMPGNMRERIGCPRSSAFGLPSSVL